MSSPSKSGSNSNLEAAAISLMGKIPEFWQDQAKLWFAQFEAVISPQKQGDETKYNLVVAKLNKEEIHEVSDIILSPPAEDKYGCIKQRLISRYEESELKKFQRLINTEIGDQKPSQLLRKMKEIRPTHVSDETIKLFWFQQLPTSVRAILSVTNTSDLGKLSEIADSIMENLNATEINSVNSHEQQVLRKVEQVSDQIERLEHDVSALSHQRRKQYFARNAGAWATPHRQLCKYHAKFKQKAYRCEKPCSWVPYNKQNLN